MSELKLDSHALSFQQEMKHLAEELLHKIDAGHLDQVPSIVNNMNGVRDRTLYDEIGKLTRALHEAMKDIKTGSGFESGLQIEQTSDKLSYVIEMTDKAANKTMDELEACTPLVNATQEGAERLHLQWQRFLRKELKADEFRTLTHDINQYFETSQASSTRVQEHLSNILMAQDFQDLTGQVINRVTQLISEVELKLVNLVSMAGNVDRITGTSHSYPESLSASELNSDLEPHSDDVIADVQDISAEGPQTRLGVEGVVSNQDDVDDLLSSLGF